MNWDYTRLLRTLSFTMFQNVSIKRKNSVEAKMTILHFWNICCEPQEQVNAERFSKTGSWSCVVQRRESGVGGGGSWFRTNRTALGQNWSGWFFIDYREGWGKCGSFSLHQKIFHPSFFFFFFWPLVSHKQVHAGSSRINNNLSRPNEKLIRLVSIQKKWCRWDSHGEDRTTLLFHS